MNRKEGIKYLLKELRKQRKWTYEDVVLRINKPNITKKKIKNWEKGIEYPNLDEIYELSWVYKIPGRDLLMARENTFTKGMMFSKRKAIKNTSILFSFLLKFTVGAVVCFYVFAIGLSFQFLTNAISSITL